MFFITVTPTSNMEKPRIQSNLPPGFTFTDPRIGLAHGSIKSPLGFTDLFHCVDIDEHFHTVYLLVVVNLYDSNTPLELCLITMKHHLKEGWCLADGATLSSDCTCASHFLLENPVYERGSDLLEEMSRAVQAVIPRMLRKNGLSSIHPILCLRKFTWFVFCMLLLNS